MSIVYYIFVNKKLIKFFLILLAVVLAYFVLYYCFTKFLIWKDSFSYIPPVVEEIIMEGSQSVSDNTNGEIGDKDTVLEEDNKAEVLQKEISHEVSFTSQAPEKNWDQPWQDACEEAALLMLDAYYHDYEITTEYAKEKILEMVAWEEEQGWGGSIPATDVEILAEHFFDYKVKVVKYPKVKELKQYLQYGKLVVALLDGTTLDNPHFRNGGPVYHALLITGYKESGFVTNDPGTQFGEDYFYSYGNLMESLHDWNDGNVPTGDNVVLVLE